MMSKNNLYRLSNEQYDSLDLIVIGNGVFKYCNSIKFKGYVSKDAVGST